MAQTTSLQPQAQNKSIVRFHDVSEVPYGVFSLLSPHPIVVRHVKYPSAHHFFLCERFKGSVIEEPIRTAMSLWDVDRLVRRGENEMMQRDNWDRVKTDVCLLACYYKFKQNADAHAILMQTGQKTLVDHTQGDSFWGDGGDGSGKNLLGVVLMAARKRLAQEEKPGRREDGKEREARGHVPQPPRGGAARGSARSTRPTR